MFSNNPSPAVADFKRRQFLKYLAGLSLFLGLPAVGKSPAPSRDLQRIAATEWLAVEMLLTLGVMPFAVSEIENYRSLVKEPVLPDGSTELGLRTEPNTELLAAMQPDLIVYAEGYGPSPSVYNSIAPSFGLVYSNKNGRPLTTSCQSLTALSVRLGRYDRAKAIIATIESEISALRLKYAQKKRRPLLLMSLVDQRHALVFGQNSLFLEVMSKAGIPGGWQGDTSFWGSAVVGIEQLIGLQETEVICFTENDDTTMANLADTALWKMMPFVKEERFRRVPGIWYYGGPVTALRFCHLLDAILEEI
ncbi:Fe(3+)-hydroxamate ABC transporter substrate-binding protein FhuD [Enterobacter mori]|uniref:Fe(3+)-hydroxamate ABC transporter substrate-binding protein FhuD n=1 Tax=Enterobacter mori TaxID=539813 RepID=UPI0021B1576A|nr:Fe(3+)-hydroxamate ABC transporter substrate-binding protein FhuD [Enterobacter mori]UWX95423.1 Fe(3+)-hydroxamate ABC transporter substrate-binding protein FhuD [Enterobacter mori]